MATTYNTPATGDKDKIRLLIGDTGPSGKFIFQDSEIEDLLLVETASLYATAALACRVLATSAAKQAVAMSMPGVDLTATEISDKYLAMAQEYDAKAEARATPLFATVYTEGDAQFDAILGRGDIDADTPIDDEAVQLIPFLTVGPCRSNTSCVTASRTWSRTPSRRRR